ncbi:MAG: dihydroorotase [Clostridia bacterium]|nr:dihydroorotase [Clostridia bacterium]
MELLLKNIHYVDSENELFVDEVSAASDFDGASFINCNNYIAFPGFADVHVHFREPGFIYKETIKSGSMAASRGGYTDVCTMPNLKPVPDCKESLDIQLKAIRDTAVIRVHPYASITVGQNGETLSDMSDLCDAIAFSDDGKGVQNDDMMRLAMQEAVRLGKMIVAHCEDNSLLFGGYIHDGEYARIHSHKGICSESEWRPIERDLKLAEETCCKYHVCHISTKESVELIRQAKKIGVNVTCETAPHYLVLDDMCLEEHGRFKMNPPIRSKKDKEALIEGIIDGTIDMIATDHAPHSSEEKSKGLSGSMMGVVGLETAFPVMYTELVKKGVITLNKLTELMSVNARKRFGLPKASIENGNFTVFDLNDEYVVDPTEFLTMGRSTPFDGTKVFGRCKVTVCDGKVVWMEDK